MSIKHKIKQKLAKNISDAIKLDPDLIYSTLESPRDPSHGDIALPCFSFAKKLSRSPQEIASQIEADCNLPDEIEELTKAGPFLNFKYSYIKIGPEIINEVYEKKSYAESKKKTLLDYSSPNIAKPFHVGHLRGTLIGNALERLYRYSGFKVESINHLGDWGTQFGFVWAGCHIWGEPEEWTVQNLVSLYKKSTALKEDQEKNKDNLNNQEDVNQLARNYFIRLESGEKEATEFWQKCVRISLDYLKKTYERFGINFDHYLGESFYYDKLDNVRNSLEKAKLLTESQGAYGVDLGEKLGFARILTPDGRSLYLARDLAAAEYRHKEFKFEKCIYVVGSPQSLHFLQLKEILKKLEREYVEGIEHVAFGHLLGIRTRGEGNSFELNEFLDDAKEKALDAYKNQVSKRPPGLDENEVAEKVSKAAIIFSTLHRTNIKDVHFNWDDALSFQGDSGPYLLYAYARINGILEKAKENKLDLKISEYDSEAFKNPETRQLLSHLMDFDQMIKDTLNSNEPLLTSTYALNLSKLIAKAYNTMKVLGERKEIAETNLAIFMSAKERLGILFSILGFEPLERM